MGFRRRNIRHRSRMALPSAFTSGNLFFGFFAIVSAIRLDLVSASWLVAFGGFLDFIDGKVARLSRSHSRFGTELDSLADVVTFGVAPAVIMFAFLLRDRGEWAWLLVFGYLFAGTIRLARYNVENPGPAKTAFNGLPIPVAGIFLVSFIPFCHTPLYQAWLGNVPYERFLTVCIVLISILMVSNVQYPTFPSLQRNGLASRVAVPLLILFGVGVLTVPEYVFFPLAFLYIVTGFLRSVIGGLWEKSLERQQP